MMYDEPPWILALVEDSVSGIWPLRPTYIKYNLLALPFAIICPNTAIKTNNNTMRFAAVVIASISIAGQIAASAKTVEYNWTLKPRRASAKDPSLSPDCNLNRLMLLVNDQLPGPSIEADVGDTVKVNINNESPTESIALHFHGLHMKGQPYKDGSATVTQCASGPLQKQTYEFIVLDQGTHYWHGRE